MSNYQRVYHFKATDPRWDAECEAARVAGRRALNWGGDPDAKLCTMQSKHAIDGYRHGEIIQNKYGYKLIENYGGIYSISSNFATHAECLEFARKWHEEAPDKRDVSEVVEVPVG